MAVDHPAGVLFLDGGLKAFLAQPPQPVQGFAFDRLPVTGGVADIGFRLNAGHMTSQVGHSDAIAKETFELVGELETGVRKIQRVVKQVGAMAWSQL